MATRKKVTTPPGLKGAAYEIWLAGLGAINLAGEEGQKIFKNLVERGREQKESNQAVMGNLKERAQGIKDDAQAALSRIAAPLETGLASAMQRMGVPTRAEIVKLTHRVEELTKHVAKAKAAAKPKAAAAPKPKPKPRAKAKAAKPVKAAPTVTA